MRADGTIKERTEIRLSEETVNLWRILLLCVKALVDLD